MRASLRRHSLTIAVALATALVTAGGPAVAAAVYDAVNADKVDGMHATEFERDPDQRRNRLVGTNGSGQLPNNIITRAPKADQLSSLEGLLGRPCTKFGQTGTLRAEYDGVVDPSVEFACAGIVGLDEYDEPPMSNDTRGDATGIWIPPGGGGGGGTGYVSISPATDLDWYTIPPCDQAYEAQVTLSEARNGSAIQMVLYKGDSDAGQAFTGTGQIDLQAGETLRIKVTATQPTKYVLGVFTCEPSF